MSLPEKRSFFYGWIILVVAWLTYGLAISPGYYGWSVVSPSVEAELDLSREQLGSILGYFVLLLGCSAPLVGTLVDRFGTRRVIPFGCLVSATGFFMMSRADSYSDCVLWFSVTSGFGVALSSQVPTQTLAANWFNKRRAMAMSIILTAGGLVGKGVPILNNYVMEQHDWRMVWVVASGISVSLAVVTFTLIRNRPSDLGQFPDGEIGEYPDDHVVSDGDPSEKAAAVGNANDFTLLEALRCPQFYVLCFAGMSATMPYNVITSQAPSHFTDIEFDPAIVAAMIGTMALTSTFGRIFGSLGDWFKPVRLMGIALLVQGSMLTLLFTTESPRIANLAIILFALGHGVAYTSSYSAFPSFFGITSFAKMAGTMGLAAGLGGFLGSKLTGRAFDQTGSYTTAVMIVSAIIITFAICALLVPSPKKQSPAE